MSAFLHIGADAKAAKSIHVRDATDTLRTIKSGFVRTAAGLKQFFGSFSLTVSVGEVEGHGYGKPTTIVYSSGVGVTVTGGNGPFTFSWARTDGGPHSIVATDPTLALTGFRATVPAADTFTATFACTVTDASGQSLTTPGVFVTLYNESLT